MPTFRLYPNSDAGPNTFPAQAMPHFSRVDEDVTTPNLADFVRAILPGQFERYGFTSVPTGLTNVSQVTIQTHSSMTNGGAMAGNMIFGIRLFSLGVEVGSTNIIHGNNDPPMTQTISFIVSLDKTQAEDLQVEYDSTTPDPNDWLALNPRWQIYTVNADITYTETEKVLSAETSNEKVLPSE